jgi:hypothetical protein
MKQIGFGIFAYFLQELDCLSPALSALASSHLVERVRPSVSAARACHLVPAIRAVASALNSTPLPAAFDGLRDTDAASRKSSILWLGLCRLERGCRVVRLYLFRTAVR